MTDQEWAQTSDGQWVPVNNPRGGSGITSATWWVFGGLAALLALTLVAAAIADAAWDTSPPAPSPQDEAVQALDDLWAGYTPSERIDFCTEARAAGYEVVTDEIGRARMLTETREVSYWLEDRCG